MKERQIMVVIKEPGKPAAVDPLFDNTLEALQDAVGGYIETFTLPSGIVLICNEEGKLHRLPYNVRVCGCDFVGVVIVCRASGDEFGSLKAQDIPKLLDILGR